MIRHPLSRFSLLSSLLVLLLAAPLQAEKSLRFRVQLLTVDANEGCDIADFDGDGKLDVVAGRNWYRNGDWTPRPVRPILDNRGYIHSNGDFAVDVNRDGRVDILAGDFFTGQVTWYENPGGEKLLQGFLWKAHPLMDTGLKTNEISYLRDLDGDGTPEWISNQWNPKAPLIAYSLVYPEGKNTPQPVTRRIGDINGHGMGFGDLNGDGRDDILVGHGWYEHPAGDPWAGPWKFHADWKRHLSCPVIVRDVDGDGQNDVIWGNPHDFGLFVWLARGVDEEGKLRFETRELDGSFSQAHCLHLADLDGDGDLELITGKRVRAHNGNDPGGREPPVLVYYEMSKEGEFSRHVIRRGDVGTGLQIRTGDLDGDGDLDIVVPGKEGTQLLFNLGR